MSLGNTLKLYIPIGVTQFTRCGGLARLKTCKQNSTKRCSVLAWCINAGCPSHTKAKEDNIKNFIKLSALQTIFWIVVTAAIGFIDCKFPARLPQRGGRFSLLLFIYLFHAIF